MEPEQITATCSKPTLPSFVKERPDLWFRQVEASFACCRIVSEAQRRNHVLSTLPAEVIVEIEDCLDSSYDELKSVIIKRYLPTETDRIQELHRMADLGGLKPSQALRRIESLSAQGGLLTPAGIKNTFLRILPASVRAAVVPLSSTTSIADLSEIADLVLATSPEQSEFGVVAAARQHVPPQSNGSQLCYYHKKFGMRAHRCEPPCSWRDASENASSSSVRRLNVE
jgi:hypothetical protein